MKCLKAAVTPVDLPLRRIVPHIRLEIETTTTVRRCRVRRTRSWYPWKGNNRARRRQQTGKDGQVSEKTFDAGAARVFRLSHSRNGLLGRR